MRNYLEDMVVFRVVWLDLARLQSLLDFNEACLRDVDGAHLPLTEEVNRVVVAVDIVDLGKRVLFALNFSLFVLSFQKVQFRL